MTETDPVAAALAEIQEHNERVIALCDMAPARVQQLAGYDVPRLLKAVEAALKLPAEWRHESEALRDAAGKVWEGAPDAAGVRLKHAYAAGYAECAKALEAAITSALSGEGAD